MTLAPAQAQVSPAVQSASGSSPSMFPNAAGFEIGGGTFVSGNMHIHHTNPDPGQTSTSLPLNIIDDTFSESEIYCNQLLRRKRGFPMYVPGPRQNTPAEYQTRGVAIGDVGRVTPEGTFDFFFNIYLPSEHPINANTPEGFTPMSQYTPADILHLDYDPGNFVSTSAIQKLDFESQSDEFPGGDFVFICGAPQGAVLALPHGARFEKLENLETLRAYVATHAESWYKYINGPRGRGLANGSLYLVTGWEKARTWGMASFHSTDEDFQLAFKPIPRADATYQYRWSGAPGRRNPAQKKSYEPSPISNGPLNQTTFIHGLSISLGTGIWGKLFGTVEIREIAESQLGLGGSNGNSTSYPPGSSLFSWSLGFFGGGTTAGGKQHAQQVILSDISPISKILHPGELISNYILHKAPQAAVVMSHDDDWRDILGDDPTGSNIQTISQFLQRINDQFNIAEKDGATFLSESESPISVEIRPPTPPVSSATNALERSPTSAHADVVITVEGPPDEPVSAGVTHEMLTMELGMHGSNLTPISPISSTTVPKRESKGLFAGIPGIRHQQLFSPIEFLSNHPYTANRQRAHSLDSKQPIPFLRSRAYSDTTASRPFVLLQSHHLQGSAIDDGSSSDVERSPSSSNPSSPARSSHHTHSPMLPSWVGGPFLAPPNAAMDRRHHARGSETASNRSTTPNLDWDRSSGIGSDPDDMDSSPHSPAWGQTAFLAPPDAAAQGRPRASSWGSPETASNPSSSLIRDSQTNNATVSTGTPFGARDRSASPSPDPPVYDSLYPRSQRPRSWAPQSDKTRVYYPGGFEPPQQKPFPGYWGQLVLKPASAEFRSTKYPDLNPILASDSTPLRYDVRQSPRNDIAPETYMSNRFSTATASSATHLRLVSKSFPWSIDIVSNSPITCEDVLDALYHALQQHIADSEWGVVIGDKKLRETIEQSAKTRTKSDRDKRLKRVDWLGGSTIFRGLDKIEEFQEMRLLPGTEPCIETWVVNMESL